MKALVAQADYNIAYLHFFRGDYNRALDLLRAARVACSAAGDSYHAALCNLDQAEIYLELDLSDEAAEMAREARAIFERLGNGYEAARALTNLAIALSRRGKPLRSLDLLKRARAQFERERNVAWPSVIDLYQALLLAHEGRYVEARPLALAALAAFCRLGLRRKEAVCELLLARIALGTGALPEAAAHCRRALAQIDEPDAPVLAHEAHFLLGQIEEASDAPADAYLSYRTARDWLESHRSVLSGDDLKIAFMTGKAAVYERLVELCMHHGEREGAAAEIFGYIEDAKSRSLRDAFFERAYPMPPRGAVGQREVSQQIRSLREELNWFHHRIESEQLNGDAQSMKRLESLHTALRRREHAFIKTLRELPPGDRAAIGLRDAAASTLTSIRAALRPETTLVEYFKTGDRILAVLLTRDDLKVVPLTTASRVTRPLRMLRFQLSNFEFRPKYLDRAGASASEPTHVHLRELYDELFAPLALAPGGHVVIVPHDFLHCVPFHALFDGRSYVADATDLSYAPSASIYALCGQRAAPPGDRALVLGVPDERAPFILDEVEAVAGLLPNVEVRTGPDASVARLRTQGPGSRIVHIATHGFFREDNPLFSGVRLGDSHLTLFDISTIPLPADLIALSGCATGLSVVSDGDELRGLTRGLLAAGARSLLVTLWDVHDRSTAQFMKFFYRSVEAGLGKAAALRAATAELRREYDHPYYWAPFILIGADSAPSALESGQSRSQ
jgi:CHAT domain-containing protein